MNLKRFRTTVAASLWVKGLGPQSIPSNCKTLLKNCRVLQIRSTLA